MLPGGPIFWFLMATFTPSVDQADWQPFIAADTGSPASDNFVLPSGNLSIPGSENLHFSLIPRSQHSPTKEHPSFVCFSTARSTCTCTCSCTFSRTCIYFVNKTGVSSPVCIFCNCNSSSRLVKVVAYASAPELPCKGINELLSDLQSPYLQTFMRTFLSLSLSLCRVLANCMYAIYFPEGTLLFASSERSHWGSELYGRCISVQEHKSRRGSLSW